jgi:hypothetical protein
VFAGGVDVHHDRTRTTPTTRCRRRWRSPSTRACSASTRT